MRFYTQHNEQTITSGNDLNLSNNAVVGEHNHGEMEDELLLAKPKVKPKRPSLYKVVLLNDDYTPMDFVVKVLENIFHKDHTEAVSVMMDIHQKGAGVCGVYTKDVAETKLDQTIYLARQHDHPLQCVIEKE